MMAMEYHRNYPAPQVWPYNPLQHHFHGQAVPPYHALHYPAHRDWSRTGAIMGHPKAPESKPRLAKDEVEQLESEFQKNPKPNSSLKKGLAEQMNVDISRINNWFQNRRAKAKQEKRSQEFQEKLNREKAEVEPQVREYFEENQQCNALVPSSAPMPQQNSHPQTRDAGDDFRPQTTVAAGDDIARSIEQSEPSLSPQPQTAYASPESHWSGTQADVSGFGNPDPFFDSSNMSSVMTTQPALESIPTTAAEAMNSFQPASCRVQGFNPLSNMMMPGAFSNDYSDVSHASPDGQHDDSSPVEYQHTSPESSIIQPPTPVQELHFKSPTESTIASRRNRPRPAPLGINSMRSQSYCLSGPKTCDNSRPVDHPDLMRRVSSASGMVKIQKPSSSPQSPFTERKQELLWSMASSPNGLQPSIHAFAPPTPNTPLMLGGHSAFREHTASSTSDEDKMYSYHHSFQNAQRFPDPAVKTPPATPNGTHMNIMSNISEAIYSTESGQYFSSDAPDEPLQTPALAGGFDSQFGIPTTMAHAVPNYVAAGCGSQPSTPSFAPPGMAHHYKGFSGSETESKAPSARSSPGQTHARHPRVQFTFSNTFPENFSSTK